MASKNLIFDVLARDAGASATFAKLTAQMEALNLATRRANQSNERLGVALQGAQKDAENAHKRGFKPLLDSALLLGPAFVPIGAAAAAAGVSLAAFGGTGLLAFAGIKKEIKDNTVLGQKYSAGLGVLKQDLTGLEHIAAAGVLTGFQTGVKSLHGLTPMLNQDVGALSTQLGQIAGHAVPGLVAVMHNLNPLFLSLGDSLVKGSVRFEQWAQSGTGVQKFVAYAQAQLPEVERTLGAVARAIGHIAEAAGPLGGVALKGITALSQAIAAIPTPVLTGLLAALQVGRLTAIAGGLYQMAGGLAAMVVAAPELAALAAGLVLVGAAYGDLGSQHKDQGIGKELANEFNDFANSTDKSAQSILRWSLSANSMGIAQGEVSKAAKDSGQSIDVLTAGISGNDDAYKKLRATVVSHGTASKADLDALDNLHQAYANTAPVLAAATVATGGLTDAQRKAYDAAHSETSQLGFLSAALNTLSGNAVTAEQQELALKDALGKATEQVKANGSWIGDNTAKGRANKEWLLTQIQAVNQHAEAVFKQTGSVQKATGALKSDEAQLRTAAVAAGLNRVQVDALIKKYEATPKQVSTKINADTRRAEGDITDFQRYVDNIHGKNINVAVQFRANLVNSSAFASIGMGGGRAEGGLLRGPGGPKGDKILILGSDNEYMIQASAVDKYGVGFMNMVNAGKFAAGGPINLRMPRGSDVESAFSSGVAGAASRWNALAPQAARSPQIGGNISALQAYALSLFPQYGWGAGQLGSLISLWNLESGWNAAAYNPNGGATGIPQALPGSKMASAGADWATNGATQIRWGLGYIASVYGSPANAWAFEMSHSPPWYGNGAWNIPRDQLAYVHRGEMVVPEPAASQVRAGSGGGLGRQVVELGPRSLDALAERIVTMDGEIVARLVSKRQAAYAVRGGRR